jgi:hypothetical protein
MRVSEEMEEAFIAAAYEPHEQITASVHAGLEAVLAIVERKQGGTMHVGERIKIRDEEGRRWWGLVTDVRIDHATIGAPGEQVQGPSETTITVVLEGPR